MKRFNSVKHAEYKILQHMMMTGKLPLPVVLKRGVPGYVLDHPLGVEQPLNEYNRVALKRYRTAIDNLGIVLNNMLRKRRPDAAKVQDKKFIPSDSFFDAFKDFGNEYEPEDDGYFWNGKELVKIQEDE
mgnify:CR=1 FL=1|tara:strand:- start:35 stop:421 length:387 start_codon:yes stop_codon:yes gene_type:complete